MVIDQPGESGYDGHGRFSPQQCMGMDDKPVLLQAAELGPGEPRPAFHFRQVDPFQTEAVALFGLYFVKTLCYYFS